MFVMFTRCRKTVMKYAYFCLVLETLLIRKTSPKSLGERLRERNRVTKARVRARERETERGRESHRGREHVHLLFLAL